MTAGAEVQGTAHHALPAHEVLLLLSTDAATGLSGQEAEQRLERFGPNVLPETSTGGWPRRLLRQVSSPLIVVLIVAGVVTALLGDRVDSGVIFGVVVVNALVGFVQESRAEAALDALRAMVHTQARVRRDGRTTTRSSESLVPGDVVHVEAGDKVPADLRLLQVVELQVDESALTGESQPAVKDEVVVEVETPVADRRNMLYSGTLVTGGTGVGVAVATGGGTELGQIHRLVGAADPLATPLTRKLAEFSRLLTYAILALAVVTFAVGVLRGESGREMFTAAVALAVGAIPEGLPAAVTITLAIGVKRMADRRAVVRRMPAVETLGSTTVVCTDKTGTLTENQMTVAAVWTPTRTVRVTGTGYRPEGGLVEDGREVDPADDRALHWSLVAGALCNDARLLGDSGHWSVIGDPTEGAMLAVAAKAGLPREALTADLPRTGALPFSSDRQYMATLHTEPDGTQVVLVKGAVERVLALCSAATAADGSSTPLDGEAVAAVTHELAGEGLRVLATAVARGPGPYDLTELRGALQLTGLQAMLDPPREAAAAAVRSCRTAGIHVKMITGDHAATATAIGARVGVLTEQQDGAVLTGPELARLPAHEYPDAVERASVFARVSPEQKLRLVRGLQSRGHVVAMTGDGVNDAPALRQADIGVAMGRSGTEVAKDAADMVLTDDDFATIEAAVEEGRGVFDNLTKFIAWTLPTNLGEGLVILVAVLLGATLPIVPVQILWINMTTAVLLGLTLAFEPREQGIMLRPPRDPSTPLLTRALAERIVLVGALLVGGTWLLFETEQARGASLDQARTVAVNLFVAVEAVYLLSCRSLTRPVWRLGLLSNRWLVGGVALQAACQLAITYVPAMNTVFRTAPIGAGAWLRLLAVAAVAGLVVGADKWVRQRAGRPAA